MAKGAAEAKAQKSSERAQVVEAILHAYKEAFEFIEAQGIDVQDLRRELSDREAEIA